MFRYFIMRKIYLLVFITCYFAGLYSQINYSFTSTTGAFTYNSTPTTLHGTGVDDVMSASTAIGFTFQFGCTNYTTFQASSNGFITLGTTAASSSAFNNLTTNTDRPVIAPLWDDLKTDPTGNVNYIVTGIVGTRVLTVEWKQMLWNYSATVWGISLQAKLYEGTNRIEFSYFQNGGSTANLNAPSASIGLAGIISGDFYSLDGTGVAPFASQAIETTSLSSKPTNTQIYRWDPVSCSGAPASGTAVANPKVGCTTFTSTLSLSGGTKGCGMTYQWYVATAAGGPYTSIAGASAATTTVSVPGVRYYRCVSICSGVLSATSTAVSTSIGVIGTGITLPYSASGQTTCGNGNNYNSANITNICGSSSYYTGEDALYRFTAAASGQITVNLGSTGSSTGLMLYNGCPTAGGTCVVNTQNNTGPKILCATLTSGVTYYLLLDSYAAPACNPYDISINSPSASSTPTCNMAYTSAVTTFSFETFTGTVLPTTDDILFNSVVFFGFPMCFDGVAFNGGYVASNAAFVFDALPCYPNILTTTYAAAGVGTGYSITAPAPVNGTSIPRNAILAPWHDINPALGGVMQYTTMGSAPNRRCIISYENIPMYSCGTSSPTIYHSSQIKIFEGTNAIEIHVKQKRVCPGHNNGGAVMGLLNYDGTNYIPPVNATAHNVNAALTYTWTMTNQAYKFTTTCGLSPGSCQNLALPIGFNTFYGERVNKINNLYWQTAVEDNLLLFKVQHSTDGINFSDIGRVTPNNTGSKYSFVDYNSVQGIINYYRIAAYEKNGKTSYTFIYSLGAGYDDVLSVSRVYPNPAGSSFMMVLDSKQAGKATVNIYTVLGNLVKSVDNTVNGGVTQYEISVNDLSNGVYYIEVLNSFNEVISKQKFIKN